ncbi:MAG: ATP-binding protein [Acidobacteriota bacterium]
MSIFEKSFNEISSQDILAFLRLRHAEGKKVDYKAALKLRTDGQRKEFLADVASFANCDGGILLLGVDEANGIPRDKLPGIPCDDPDETKGRIENIILSGIEPSIRGHDIGFFEVEGKTILLLRVPRSWARPHMVVFQRTNKFYSRNSHGKYLLDVTELREAFLLQDTIERTISDFRTQRISEIANGDLPFQLAGGGKLIVHLFPIPGIAEVGEVDLHRSEQCRVPRLGTSRPAEQRYNFEGLLASVFSDDGQVLCYTQIYRKGTVEAVNAVMLREKVIRSAALEKSLVRFLFECVRHYGALGVNPPLIVTGAMTGVKGMKMGVRGSVPPGYARMAIDKDILVLPKARIDSFDDLGTAAVLKPLIDSVWNACGWPCSENFDVAGIWQLSL